MTKRHNAKTYRIAFAPVGYRKAAPKGFVIAKRNGSSPGQAGAVVLRSAGREESDTILIWAKGERFPPILWFRKQPHGVYANDFERGNELINVGAFVANRVERRHGQIIPA